jgi:hypothetical protein
MIIRLKRVDDHSRLKVNNNNKLKDKDNKRPLLPQRFRQVALMCLARYLGMLFFRVKKDEEWLY